MAKISITVCDKCANPDKKSTPVALGVGSGRATKIDLCDDDRDTITLAEALTLAKNAGGGGTRRRAAKKATSSRAGAAA